MFDRASMKLGLDKALLQKMDKSTDQLGKGSKSKASGLSKEEVEDLLKKGAYGAFMDDGAGDKFCEEDIDQILERRTMVIRHDGDSEERKGSMFSKASFQAANSSIHVDVNDPDFWDKVKEQAQLDVSEDILEDSLIIDLPRARKQLNNYEVGGENDHDPSEDYKRPQTTKIHDIKLWTTTERTRLERVMMQHGYFQFEKISTSFNRRTAEQLQACCRALLLRCLDTSPSGEKDVIADVIRAIGVFYPPKELIGSSEDEIVSYWLDTPDPKIVEIDDSELPWADAEDKDRIEYASFMAEAPPDYLEHLGKKAKNLLIRVALVQF
jgi:hypothetical protein